jgi:tail lysozyme
MGDVYDILTPEAVGAASAGSPPARPPAPGWLETISLSFKQAGAAPDWGNNDTNWRYSALREVVDALKSRGAYDTALDPRIPRLQPGETYLDAQARTWRALFRQVQTVRQADAQFLSDYKDVVDQETFDRLVNGRRSTELARLTGRLQDAPTLPWLIGGLGHGLTDPTSYIPVAGAGGTIARQIIGTALREGAANVAFATVTEPFVQMDAARLGVDRGVGDAALDITVQGLTGLVIGGAAKTAQLGAGPAYDATVGTAFDLAPEPLKRRWADAGTIDDRRLLDTFRKAVPEGYRAPEEQAAISVLERDVELREASPFEAGPDGDAAHDAGLAAALQSIIAGPRPRSELLSSTAGASTPPVRPRAPGGLPGGLPGDIVGFFRANGYSEAQARGIAAGVAAEAAGGNHRAINPTSGAYGLGQWLGSRKRELFRRYGPNPSRLQQLEFLHWELQGGDAGGRHVLAASDQASVLDAYIRKFMRPAPGAETIGDLERGMAALGLEGLPARGQPGQAALAAGSGVDPAIAALRSTADEAEAEALALSRSAELEPVPALRRELFDSDDDWLDAQVALHRSIRDRQLIAPEAAVDGPPARESPPSGPDTAAASPAGAQRAPGEATEAGAEYAAIPARYAKNKMLVRSDDGSGFKTRAAYLAEALGGRWSNRESGYVMSRAAVTKLEQLYAAGFNADVRIFNDQPVTFYHRERGLKDLTVAQALGLSKPLPLTRAELEAIGRPASAKLDALWYAGLNAVTERELGREPKPLWALRDKRTGELVSWGVTRRAVEDEKARHWEPDQLDLEHLHPENIAFELRARAADQEEIAEAAAVRLDDPALQAFDDPAGEGRKQQVESLEHDLRMQVEAAAERADAEERLRSAAPRSFAIPPQADRPIAAFSDDPAAGAPRGSRATDQVRAHPDFKAAKAGDDEAAERLVRDLVRPEQLELARAELDGAIFVPVIAEEEAGRNLIPLALAKLYAKSAGGRVEMQILQTVRAHHTGKTAIPRMRSRALFDGPVIAGERYVIVDDNALQGGTIAELADLIQRGGGTVERVVLLGDRTGGLHAPDDLVARLRERGFEDVVREEFGHELETLSGPEARWVAKFSSPDRLRAKVAEELRKHGARADERQGSGRTGGGGGAPDRLAEEPAPFAGAPERTYRLSEGGPELTLREILDELDADEAAIAALRDCLKPGGGGA